MHDGRSTGKEEVSVLTSVLYVLHAKKELHHFLLYKIGHHTVVVLTI